MSLNRDCLRQSVAAADVEELDSAPPVALVRERGSFRVPQDCVLPAESREAATLVKKKFVYVPLKVASPMRFHAPPPVTSTAETTAMRHGRATPPPTQIPPFCEKSMWRRACASSWSF